jgi:hypothetical protein
MEPHVIRVLVDDLPAGAKAARAPLESIIARSVGRTIEIGTEALAKELCTAFGNVASIVSQLPQPVEPLKLDSVTFTLAIDTGGKVSLLSAVGGSVAARVGLTFTLSRSVA